MRWQWWGLAVFLSGCSGGGDSAVGLCIDEAKRRLDGQVHRIDEKALANSKTTEADGTVTFNGEMTLKPGTSAEEKQTFICTIAPASGDSPARVLNFQVRWSGSGLAN